MNEFTARRIRQLMELSDLMENLYPQFCDAHPDLTIIGQATLLIKELSPMHNYRILMIDRTTNQQFYVVVHAVGPATAMQHAADQYRADPISYEELK